MDDERNQPLPESQARHEPIGTRLRLRREALDLRIEDVARHLHLDTSVVRALESDDFDALPGPAYIKGYLRAYGQLLELDVRVLIDAYRAQAHPAEPELKPAVEMNDRMALRGRVYAFGSAIALVLILLAAWWYTHDQSIDTNPPVAEHSSASGTAAPAAPTPAIAPTLPLPTTATAPTASTTAMPQTATVPIPPSVSPSPAVVAGETAAPSAATPAGQARLQLNLTHRSWVQVDDAKGQQLVYGLLDAGTHRLLTGSAPFSVFLGYAQGVQLSIDGQRVDIAPHIRANHTARFKVSVPSDAGGTGTSP
ncbi:helix-turn-helix domain-containing protein [Acidihalobacter prosperus]|uniref:HTH cro/C1-type domain-containing protein n=1 Tax=Acidihalobacter prosperus TaxID=160660 RepID=A0A1A6C7X1_9GAMM|nr:helix-turn-helix domain-containing protein [Acidihalobacter prosperus]OBS10644.1 hypothetical protein Thpro_020360 [Acidihalobacter prosperus]